MFSSHPSRCASPRLHHHSLSTRCRALFALLNISDRGAVLAARVNFRFGRRQPHRPCIGQPRPHGTSRPANRAPTRAPAATVDVFDRVRRRRARILGLRRGGRWPCCHHGALCTARPVSGAPRTHERQAEFVTTDKACPSARRQAAAEPRARKRQRPVPGRMPAPGTVPPPRRRVRHD